MRTPYYGPTKVNKRTDMDWCSTKSSGRGKKKWNIGGKYFVVV
jgi:hypothetical protein